MIEHLLVELLDSISKWGIRHGRVDRRGRVENERDFCAPRVKLTVRIISLINAEAIEPRYVRHDNVSGTEKHSSRYSRDPRIFRMTQRQICHKGLPGVTAIRLRFGAPHVESRCSDQSECTAT